MAVSKSLEAVLTSVVMASLECPFEIKDIKAYEIYEGGDLVIGRKYCIPEGQVSHEEKFKGIPYGAYYTVDNSGRKGKISAKSFNKVCHDISCKTLQAERSQFKSSTGNSYWCPVQSGKAVRLWSGEFPPMAIVEEAAKAKVAKRIYFKVTGSIEVREPLEEKGQFVYANKDSKTVKTKKVNKLTYEVITEEEFLKK